MRTHIIVPDELLNAVDALVGARRRSKFFVEAASEKLAHVRLVQAARKAVGSLADVDIPEWETPERARAWVRGSRQAVGARLNQREEQP
jgi:metal-responsive CopG/Arc/MetJ family transcriptional regulator